MPGPTGSQFRPLSRLRKRPARAVPQYTRAGPRGSTATHPGDRPPKCSSMVQVEARRAINRAACVTTMMPTMLPSAAWTRGAQRSVDRLSLEKTKGHPKSPAYSGCPLFSSENTPVLLACPLLERMPPHLWEIAVQALDVGGIPCTIEPLEHQS